MKLLQGTSGVFRDGGCPWGRKTSKDAFPGCLLRAGGKAEPKKHNWDVSKKWPTYIA